MALFVALLAPSCAPRDVVDRGVTPGGGAGGGAGEGGSGGGSGGGLGGFGGDPRGNGGTGGGGATDGPGPARDGGGPAPDGPGAEGPRPPDGPAPADVNTTPDLAPDRAPDLPPPDLPPPDVAPPDGPSSRIAALVVGAPTPLAAPDIQVQTRLQGKGFMVRLVDDAAPATTVDGTSLVVISSTASSGMVAAKYVMVPVPTVVLDSYLFDDMRMTLAVENTDYGETMLTQQVNIVMSGHQLAAGLSGMVTVTTSAASIGFGLPASGAERVATLQGMANRFAVFGYPPMSQMAAGMLAPARRVGIFATSTAITALTPAGWMLFDAAVDWAMRP